MIDRTRGYRIYRNLNAASREDTWTVQHYVFRKGWRKWRGAGCVWMPRAAFKVYEAGNARVRATGKKNVHAYILATDIEFADSCPDSFTNFKVIYNPRTHNTFVGMHSGDDIVRRNLTHAHELQLTDLGGVYAKSITFKA